MEHLGLGQTDDVPTQSRRSLVHRGQAGHMRDGSHSTISGTAYSINTAAISIKNIGAGARNPSNIALGQPLITKRFNPTGGVICAISTTSTMKMPNQIRSYPRLPRWAAARRS